MRLEIIEEEAVVVRRIFQLSAEGMGLAGIAKLMNAEGVPRATAAANQGHPRLVSVFDPRNTP